MRLSRILNQCHPIPGFVYGNASFDKARQSILIDVRPRKRTLPICSGCHKPTDCTEVVEWVAEAQPEVGAQCMMQSGGRGVGRRSERAAANEVESKAGLRSARGGARRSDALRGWPVWTIDRVWGCCPMACRISIGWRFRAAGSFTKKRRNGGRSIRFIWRDNPADQRAVPGISQGERRLWRRAVVEGLGRDGEGLHSAASAVE